VEGTEDFLDELEPLEVAVVGKEEYSPNLVDTAIALKGWVMDRPFKFWAMGTLGLGAIATMLGVFSAMNGSNAPDKPGVEVQNDLYLQMISPQSLAGITPDTTLPEAVERLQYGIREYDTILNPATDEAYKQALSVVAREIKENALKEEQSGVFDPTSPIPLVNLADCPKEKRIYLCVLVRNQLQGIAAYEKAARELKVILETDQGGRAIDAIAGMNRGKVWYEASVLAMGNNPIEAPTVDRIVLGMTHKTLAYDALYNRLSVDKVQPALGVGVVEGEKP
jgi:hypothetical protein